MSSLNGVPYDELNGKRYFFRRPGSEAYRVRVYAKFDRDERFSHLIYTYRVGALPVSSASDSPAGRLITRRRFHENGFTYVSDNLDAASRQMGCMKSR